ncbi:hypothetical protein KR093_003308, partial [Drosophila rubida]
DNNDGDAKDIEIKNESPQRIKLEMGFLDELADVDIEGVVNEVRSRREGMDLITVKTESVNTEMFSAANADDDEELRQLKAEHNKIVEILQRREAEKQLHNKKKKHKKEKKHKRRRSHSHSPVPKFSRKKERRVHKTSSSSNDAIELDFVPVRECEKTLKIINIKKLLSADNDVVAAAAPNLSIREKRKLAVDRAKSVLKLLALQRSKSPSTEYLFVDTIKRMPSRSSVLSGTNFENASPLCNNFNVIYQFNSTTPNISLAKWGLEALPSATVALMRLTGINVTRLMKLLQHSKMPLQKLRQEENAIKSSKGTGHDDYMCTGLFRSLSTQTDCNIGNRTRDIAVQTMPTQSTSHQSIFWLDSRFCETNLSQQHANVVFALKELCATIPSSTYWADALYNELHKALVVKRKEIMQLDS